MTMHPHSWIQTTQSSILRALPSYILLAATTFKNRNKMPPLVNVSVQCEILPKSHKFSFKYFVSRHGLCLVMGNSLAWKEGPQDIKSSQSSSSLLSSPSSSNPSSSPSSLMNHWSVINNDSTWLNKLSIISKRQGSRPSNICQRNLSYPTSRIPNSS